jgi:hypothetical protein
MCGTVCGVSTCASVVILLATLVAAQDAAKPLMRIYFIPFAVETQGPVTKEDIEQASFYRIALGRTRERSPREPDPLLVTRLPAVLRAHPTVQKLRENFIRLKVEAGGTAYYVDNKGTVLESSSGRMFHLTKDEMQRLNQDIVNLRGVVDVDVCSGLTCPSSK